MGINLKDLVEGKPITIDELRGRVLIVDAFNILYQFLTTIRQPDGTPLKTSTGVITSHLVGLFNRTTKLMLSGIKLAFVFDGEPPKLKELERERRALGKIEAMRLYEEAKIREDVDAMRKYAARTSRLSAEMVEDAKQLLVALGVPVIQAPSEGEAQAAYMVSKGFGYGVVSEDNDCLLFGVPRLIKGLSITRRRKERDKLNYIKTEIELIELEHVLNTLGINQDQLIVLGMLIGTDFNPGGIPGIGPKRALQIVKTLGSEPKKIFEEVKWQDYFSFDWRDVFNIFKHSKHTDEFKLEWKAPDMAKVKELLVARFEFSESNVTKKLQQLEKYLGSAKQQSLGDFFAIR
ncbi:flap endonuclease-1 [Candidatus Woesearchaeota archaeon]|nr:flap endonuclease-1 [Candidatus Woesearchaeota archaeon]RLE41954.1 MAG: flap endonuclease-1 [Candidatus Woesearchaeota archaeon]